MWFVNTLSTGGGAGYLVLRLCFYWVMDAVSYLVLTVTLRGYPSVLLVLSATSYYQTGAAIWGLLNLRVKLL